LPVPTKALRNSLWKPGAPRQSTAGSLLHFTLPWFVCQLLAIPSFGRRIQNSNSWPKAGTRSPTSQSIFKFGPRALNAYFMLRACNLSRSPRASLRLRCCGALLALLNWPFLARVFDCGSIVDIDYPSACVGFISLYRAVPDLYCFIYCLFSLRAVQEVS
jgi:hypothetical protein